MNKLPYYIIIPIITILIIDIYTYQAIHTATNNLTQNIKKTIKYTHHFITITSIIITTTYIYSQINTHSNLNKYYQTTPLKHLFHSIIGTIYIIKISIIPILLTEDTYRATKWIINQIQNNQTTLNRSPTLAKTTITLTIIPITIILYGIIIGRHNYKIRKETITLPNLPKSFHNIKIAQISDIHAGSFTNKKAVQKGINIILQQKPDIILFTGDLVNTHPNEIDNYIDIFKQLKAPLGTYSVLGNHDYIYQNLSNKPQTLQTITNKHKQLGWQLLNNQNKIIKKGTHQIAIIGVENWGIGRFPKYGDIQKAHKNTQNIPVKILLSHDPSHWEEQITKQYKDIDITFSGHTHGGQLGIEIDTFKWSPVKYRYKQWAGLYKKQQQYLYVNRGFGHIGYLGRIGIPPEITIIQLKSTTQQ